MILKVTGLCKTHRGSGFRLGPVDLSIQGGENVALFGKNGAGKSTLFQLLTANSDAKSGGVWFRDERLVPESYLLKRKFGYLPQHMGLPRWVSGLELLNYAASLYQLDAAVVEQSLSYWDCQDFARKPLAACSHGMQKRIGLALATIHQPDVLILDEPFSGLDIYHIRALEKILEQRGAEQKITIMSTHVIPYASTHCHRALALDAGKFSEFEMWGSADFAKRQQMIESFFF
jgi:ABC-type multidrug transport system ATPase subunit